MNYYGTTSSEPTELELKNRALARRAAAEGFVLLKNEGGALPLRSKKIALYGMGARKTVKYFKNVQYDPACNLGLVKLTDGGKTAQLLWGFTDGGQFTSEFPAHMMSHAARLAVDPDNRVVMHCHPANLLAMTYVHDLDSRAFTRTLWQMCTECIVVFPDGVNVLPWMLCGTTEIGQATAEQMDTARLVVWAQHGIYGAGRDLDETFGLIETAEKAAEIYMKIAHLPLVNTITDQQMHQLEERFGVKAREGYLK